MISEKEVLVTHECNLGINAVFCLEDSDSICEPGLRSEIRVAGYGCRTCPRNPEVPCIAEAKMGKILSDFRKSTDGEKWQAEQEGNFLGFFMTGQWEELEPDRKFYYTDELYNDAWVRYTNGETVKMVRRELNKS